jgi:hypothetical protein
MAGPKSQAPSPGGKTGALEKIFEEVRERDRLEYIVYADINNDMAKFVEITIIHYPMKQYSNHVKLILDIFYDDKLSLGVRRVRNNWNGTGLDFTNMITIYTTQEFDYSSIISRERYEKINSIKDVKELVSDILELFEDFVEYYIKQVVEEFTKEEEQ